MEIIVSNRSALERLDEIIGRALRILEVEPYQGKGHDPGAGVLSRKSSRSPHHNDHRMYVRNSPGDGNALGEKGSQSKVDPSDPVDAHQSEEITSPDEIIYGVLLVPDEADLDGDRFPAEIISKACKDYSTRLEADEQHKFSNPDLEVTDSFISTDGYAINGHPVKPGSWVVGIRTKDQSVIDKVKSGDYRGLSIEGTAVMKQR